MEPLSPICVVYPKPRWTQESAKADFAKTYKKGRQAKVVPRKDHIYIHTLDADDSVLWVISDEDVPQSAS